MNITASLVGIGSAVVAFMVMVRVMDLSDMIRLVKRGVMAIVAFVVLGTVVQMYLPGFLTAGIVACLRSSLLLGVAIVVIALALMLFAKRRASANSQNKH